MDLLMRKGLDIQPAFRTGDPLFTVKNIEMKVDPTPATPKKRIDRKLLIQIREDLSPFETSFDQALRKSAAGTF